MYSSSVLDQIGSTPIVCLRDMTGASIFAKAEHLNPGGSIKDRVARFMLEEAERMGTLKPGMTVMEPTSGNTGIGVALVGRRMGYRVVIVMPENMSDERKKIIYALGAEMVLTPADESIDGALREVKRLQEADPNIYVPQQFENPANPKIHTLTTGPEIWTQLGHHVDAFVSGLGSGGTLQGVVLGHGVAVRQQVYQVDPFAPFYFGEDKALPLARTSTHGSPLFPGSR